MFTNQVGMTNNDYDFDFVYVASQDLHFLRLQQLAHFQDVSSRLENVSLLGIEFSKNLKHVKYMYLASGCSFADLHDVYRLGKSTTIEIVHVVCKEIWKKLETKVMAEPTEERRCEISNDFEKCANFPNCVGAIDGKHIRITKPKDSGSLYYNYKNYFSTVWFGLCDANYCSIATEVAAYGKSTDSATFQNSVLYKVCTVDQTPLAHVIVGDEAFSLTENVMLPFSGKTLTYKKIIFNYRLSRARRYIECTFGILASKWRIFHGPLNVYNDFVEEIVKACCVLHNYVEIRDGYSPHVPNFIAFLNFADEQLGVEAFVLHFGLVTATVACELDGSYGTQVNEAVRQSRYSEGTATWSRLSP
ncbi:hypothetical protein PR048_021950 [Dryococelus australis]|uniref:DDE Tnp4 domain-containing protein n=1 Tax=Dryococelus australis TaxID=614101 RepID=A0ABQ9GZP7_9NEOP|nr:hypothetical protein PR048_021950 [Dryococelus australis]